MPQMFRRSKVIKVTKDHQFKGRSDGFFREDQ